MQKEGKHNFSKNPDVDGGSALPTYFFRWFE